MNEKIGPSKMRPLPQFKLMDVWEMNDYKLSRKDFDTKSKLMGEGSFGEVHMGKLINPFD